jgi:MYXO-CTERM domain-containing protein
MGARKLCAASASLLAIFSSSAGALAQRLYIDTRSSGLARDGYDGLAMNEINRADCERDELAEFVVAVEGVVPSNLAFQVWRGTDCADPIQRFDDASNCVELDVQVYREGPSVYVGMGVQQILGATKSSTNPVCAGDPSFPEPSEFSLHFILADANGDPPVEEYAPAIWTARYDLIGPAEPRAVEANAGDGELVLSWAIDDDRGDIDHYNVYCDPPPGATIDGEDHGGVKPEYCPTPRFGRTAPPPEYFCGESAGYGASLHTAPLQNDVLYTVAVAAVDHFMNVGTLSEPDCEVPRLTQDDSGPSSPVALGGRGCSCSVGTHPSNGTAVLVAVGGVALYTLRRGRSRRERF